MSTDKKMTLEGEEAIDLWGKGKAAWNQWVEGHPEADIDFSRVDFGQYRNNPDRLIRADKWPFAEFQFPKGKVSFEDAQFGEGKVSFNNAQFGEGGVSFEDAQFGEGGVSFNNAQFGEGGVSFFGTQFGKGTVSFHRAQFGEGNVYFHSVRFGEGEVSFNNAQFGEGKVSFNNARFGEGKVSFNNARFGEGEVSFNNAQFGEGKVFFNNAQFGKGTVSFDSAKFEGQADFSDLTQEVTAFSFRNAHFGQSLTLSSENSFACVPDLINTHMGHHVSLRGVHLSSKLETKPEDIERLCRFKELAQVHQNTEQALEFKAQEMRAIRRHDAKGMVWFLNWGFDKVSDYGRSEWRPLCGLVGVWVFFGLFYGGLSAWCSSSTAVFNVKLGNGLAFSASQMLSLIPSSREVGKTARVVLFSDSFPLWLYPITIVESLLAIIFLFLLGLALRNRFRL